ncbi:MAG: response regulator [Desulfocapsaceae bacterium]|nr:response regulator [Desulfocapsaceae bacterium]
MKEILKWLREVEELASEIYLQASTQYEDDDQLTQFLQDIAEEEAWHYHVIGSATSLFEEYPETLSAITLDEKTSSRILNYFYELRDGLTNKSFSQDELLRRIVEVEMSEWNDIFIYVVNTLTAKKQEFRYPAIRMQSHLRNISNYLDKIGRSKEILSNISTIPPVWVEKILIVDDEPMISRLIKSLLNRDGDVDIAENGAEALNLLKNKYYKLIISDIEMPVMDGLSFYKEAKNNYPNLQERFLFMTGNLTPERQKFLEDEGVPFLTKPMEIAKLEDICSKILLKA